MTSSLEPHPLELKTVENPESDASPAIEKKADDEQVEASQEVSQSEVEYWSK